MMMDTQSMMAMEAMLEQAAAGAAIGALAVLFLVLAVWFIQAGLSASLARKKGYSGFASFIFALLLPGLWIIYAAGRPMSPRLEAERQRALANRIAKIILSDDAK